MQDISFHTIIIILGIIFLFADVLFIGTLDLVMIGINMIIGGIVGGIFNNMYITLGISGVLSLFSLVLLRGVLKKKLEGPDNKTNIDNLIGQTGVAMSEISPQVPGQLKINGEIWRAVSDDTIESGDKANVLSVEGVTLTISKKH